MRLLSALPCLFIALTACQEPGFGNREKPKEPEAVEPAALALPATLVPLEAPNQYRVDFDLSDLAFVPYQLVRHDLDDDEIRTLSTIGRGHHSKVSDSEIEAGRRYHYRLRSAEGSLALYEITVKVPLDLEVASGTSFPGLEDGGVARITGFGRLFLRKGSSILGGTRPISISVSEIVADDAVISSSAFASEPGAGIQGAPAPTISISAKAIRGRLTVKSKGQKGGPGVKGPKGRKGPVGPPGATLNVGGSFPATYTWCAYAGDPEFGGKYYDEPPYDRWLANHPGRGKKGERGLEGYPGGPGATGGRGGDVTIDVEEVADGALIVDASGGDGGNGGPGGDGGEGGDGGPGGGIQGNHACSRGTRQCCRLSPAGVLGDPGPLGPDGPVGAAGEPGKITINRKVQQREVYP